jgi:chromosome segregation ATPase
LRDDVALEVEVDLSAIAEQERRKDSVPSKPAPAALPQGDGLLGVRRWRIRFDAIRASLDELESFRPAPAEIDHAMAFAARTLEELEESVVVAEGHQATVESLADKARDFRATLGKTIDELGGELSKKRGELEQLVHRRNDLSDRREAVRARLRAPVHSPPSGEVVEGEADAILWELAALEEEVRGKGAQCDELESQVGDLRARLERENERFEVEIAALVQVLDAEMQRLEPMAAALRAPLEKAEHYVRENWPKKSGTPS